MLKYKRPRLLAVTFGTALVQPRHRQAAGGLKNVGAMQIMALHAVHAAFGDWMVLGKTELSVDVQMTLETGGWISAGIHDEFAPATARLDVLAAGAVAGLAAGLARQFRALKMQAAVRAGRKHAGDVRVAIITGFVA